MTKGHDKGHKGQMSDREVMNLALEALESSQESGSVGVKIDNAITALRQALDQLPDTTKMIEPEELVCVCGAIWQGQEMICPPRCLDEGIEREMPTDRGAWSDVEDATKWVDELRGDDEPSMGLIPSEWAGLGEPPNSTTDVVEAEPVAWLWKNQDGHQVLTADPDYADGTWTPLYAAPPKREWVGLTHSEVDSLELPDCPTVFEFVQFIEAKLKEKNND